MIKGIIRSTLTAAALLLTTSLVLGADVTLKTPDVKGSVKAGAESVRTDAKATAGAAGESVKGAATRTGASAKAALVDINTASEAELRVIPGIGEAFAAKIIAGRPYARKDQLKSRNILPSPAYEKVKDRIIARQPAKQAVPVKK